MHKLTDFRKARTKEYAYCLTCQKEVEVVNKPRVGGGVNKRCSVELKAKRVSEARLGRKRAVRASQTAKKRNSETMAWLWRQICYHRADFTCEICGKKCEVGVFGPTALHAHHVVKRSQSQRLQLDPANAMAVCGPCHQGADRDQVRCLAILQERDPGIVTYLLAERRRTDRPDPAEVEKRLRETAAIYGIEVPE